MRVFLDANILFSASDASSATRRLLDITARQHVLVTSGHAWEEARRNLERKRPHLLAGLDGLRTRVEMTLQFRLPENVDLVEKDKPILAAAVGAQCSHLWTSDRLHFGMLYGQTTHGVTVVSSIQLADLMGKGG